MVKLKNNNISEKCRNSLENYQEEIDRESNYPAKLEKAKEIWPIRSKNKPFEEVRKKLKEICIGAQRCHYCEDSAANEIEHYKPKDIYPEETFKWDNFLYVCGPCNKPKNNRFAVFEEQTRVFTDVTPSSKQKEGDVRTRPVAGDSVIINPRFDDPFKLIDIDLLGDFALIPHEKDKSSEEYLRAEYTIRVLKLNQRDELLEARRNTYENYKARLMAYVAQKEAGSDTKRLQNMENALKREQHPSVWLEIKWHKDRISEFKALFDKAPEALDW